MLKLKSLILISCLFLVGCGFHLQGEMKLAPKFHFLYLQTSDPYGFLTRQLKQYLKMSKVQLVDSPAQADIILAITRDVSSQTLASVSGSQQTRQYNLEVSVSFDVTDSKGRSLIPPQSFTEARVITVQSNQVLGSSNEENLFYSQMRRTLAYSIMNRLASKEVTEKINRSTSSVKPLS